MKKITHSINFRGKEYTLLLDANSIIDETIIKYGQWEGSRLEKLHDLIEEKISGSNFYFLDLGACFGYYSIVMSGHENIKKSIAVEASTYNFNKLCANIFINELDNCVDCLNFALNDVSEAVRFVDPRDVANDNSHGLPELPHADYNQGGAGIAYADYDGRVEVIKADAFDNLVEIDNCSIVAKIDVEGHEIPALHGLLSTFKRNKVLLQIEAFKTNFHSLRVFLEKLEFEYLTSLGDDHYFCNNVNVDVENEIFAVLPEKAGKLRYARSQTYSMAKEYISQSKNFIDGLPYIPKDKFGDYHAVAAHVTGWADFGEVEGHILAGFIEKEGFEQIYVINNNAAIYYASQSNSSPSLFRVSPRRPKPLLGTHIISIEELYKKIISDGHISKALFVIGSHSEFDFDSDLYAFYNRILPNLTNGTYLYFHNIFSPNVTIRKEHPGFVSSVDSVDSAALNLYLQYSGSEVIFCGLSAINDDWCANALAEKVEMYGITRQEISTFIVKTK